MWGWPWQASAGCIQKGYIEGNPGPNSFTFFHQVYYTKPMCHSYWKKQIGKTPTLFTCIPSTKGNMSETRVADPRCFSRSRNPDPGSLIPDPTTATKEEGETNLRSYLSVAPNFTKLEIIYFWTGKEINLSQFTKKYCTHFLSSHKYGFGIGDSWSGENLFRILGSKRHRIPYTDPQHGLKPAWKFF